MRPKVVRLGQMTARIKKLKRKRKRKRKRSPSMSFGELVRKLWQSEPEKLEPKVARSAGST